MVKNLFFFFIVNLCVGIYQFVFIVVVVNKYIYMGWFSDLCWCDINMLFVQFFNDIVVGKIVEYVYDMGWLLVMM